MRLLSLLSPSFKFIPAASAGVILFDSPECGLQNYVLFSLGLQRLGQIDHCLNPLLVLVTSLTSLCHLSIALPANPSESDFVLMWVTLRLSNSFLNADSYAYSASVIIYEGLDSTLPLPTANTFLAYLVSRCLEISSNNKFCLRMDN